MDLRDGNLEDGRVRESESRRVRWWDEGMRRSGGGSALSFGLMVSLVCIQTALPTFRVKYHLVHADDDGCPYYAEAGAVVG